MTWMEIRNAAHKMLANEERKVAVVFQDSNGVLHRINSVDMDVADVHGVSVKIILLKEEDSCCGLRLSDT